jgi:hypothetical protein
MTTNFICSVIFAAGENIPEIIPATLLQRGWGECFIPIVRYSYQFEQFPYLLHSAFRLLSPIIMDMDMGMNMTMNSTMSMMVMSSC